MNNKNVVATLIIGVALVLSGCGAMNTAIKKRNLEVKTQMSETIFLEPSNERTVFLQINVNTDRILTHPAKVKLTHPL